MAEKKEENRRAGGRKGTVIAMGIICTALLAAGILGRHRILDFLRLREDAGDVDSGRAEAEDGLRKDSAGRGARQEDRTEKGTMGNGGNPYGTKEKEAGEPESRQAGPRSDFFRRIAEVIWEKQPEDIGPEEYDDLTSLRIDRDNGLVSYQLNHGYVGTFVCPEDLEADFSDLASFEGLEWIYVDGSLEPDDLPCQENLSGIHSRNTVNELSQIIQHPERITELGIAGDSSEKSLEGIEVFPNLKYLSVRCEGLEDISALKQFTGLQGLILEGCSQLRDYSPLLALEDLERLKISACRLESIQFITSRPKLVSLSLEDVVIADWAEGLFGIPTLRELYLNGCRMALDFDRMPVNEGLEILSLSYAALRKNPVQEEAESGGLSDYIDVFECFPNLKELYLAAMGLDDISFVEKLPHLQYLDITGNPVRNLEPLEHLEELRGIGCGDRDSWTML